MRGKKGKTINSLFLSATQSTSNHICDVMTDERGAENLNFPMNCEGFRGREYTSLASKLALAMTQILQSQLSGALSCHLSQTSIFVSLTQPKTDLELNPSYLKNRMAIPV